MKSIYEEAGGTYTRQGDYELPDLKIPPEREVKVGVWGQRYRQYLKQHHRIRYYNLLTAGKLNEHLAEIDHLAELMFQSLVNAISEQENVTEKLKADDPMEWVKKMNNIRNRAAEIVNSELIFVWESRNIISTFLIVNAVLQFKISFGFGINCVRKGGIPTLWKT